MATAGRAVDESPLRAEASAKPLPLLHAIVLGVVQGLSEFLPISSSGHLVVVPWLFGWDELANNPDLKRTFDVALHVGTFVGAFVYFRTDVARYAASAVRSLRRRRIETGDERMAWLLVLASLPAAVIGAVVDSAVDEYPGGVGMVGLMLVVFGVVLFAADRAVARRPTDAFSARDAVLVGMAQALALQPGVSRSGATISMARWLGFDRYAATRISFLMSLPIIAGAGFYKGAQLVADGGLPAGVAGAFTAGTIAAAVTGFAAVWGLLRLVRTRTFAWFVAYRVVAGLVVLAITAAT